MVEDEGYGLHLLAYVHLNPVVVGIERAPDDALCTRHPAYVGLEAPPDWLTTGELLDLHGRLGAYRAYVSEVQAVREEGPEGWDADELWRPEQSAGFPLRAPEQRPIGQAMAEVCEVIGQLRGALTEGRRGTGRDPERWVGAWRLERAAGLSQVEVAVLLGASPVLVSRWRCGLRTCEDVSGVRSER